MTEAMSNLNLNTYMGKDIPEQESPKHKKSKIAAGILAIALLVVCYWVSSVLISEKQQEIVGELQTRQELTINGKADVINTWVEQTGQQANVLTSNPLIQLFATEINSLDGDNLSAPLQEQLPYMQNAITRFVQENNLVAAYMVGKDGRAYLASSGSPALTDDQRRLAQEGYDAATVGTTPLRETNGELVFDFLIPVRSAQINGSSQMQNVGVFLMTVSAAEKLSEFTRNSKLSEPGEQTHLYQRQNDKLIRINTNYAPYFASEEEALPLEGIKEFGARTLPGQSLAVFSVGADVENTALTLLRTVPVNVALQELETYRYVVFGLAASAFIVIVSVVSGIWFALRTQSAKDMAGQYKDLATQINAQRRLLGSINNTVHDLISLKDVSGKYVYANPSLAEFVSLPEQSIPGKSDRELFGDKVARKFAEMDERVLNSGQKTSEIVEVDKGGIEKFLRVEKTRLLDDDGIFMGIVTVCGDITDYIINQRQKDELGRKTISILVRMMEENDPHLAGHSHHMSEIAGNVADILKLPQQTKQTLLTGANLSQIGKISIPSKIRTKESRLTKKEMEIMQGHVSKAENLLSEMEIDQAVITAVGQMYERRDGSGYPRQLKDEEIDLSARVLGMADILVARVSPRSYRQAISVEEAMEVFRTNPEKYDPAVVEAFDSFLQSPEGLSFRDRLEEAAKNAKQ